MSATLDKPMRAWIATGEQDRASRIRDCIADFSEGLAKRELWLFLGWRDVRKHYSRSILGPFWLTLSMGVMVAGLGVLYSQIFGMAIDEYLPFLAVGFIVWGLISGSINGACNVYSQAANSIRQIRLPHSVYVFQFMWTQLITFAHNFIIYIAVALIFTINPGWHVLLVFPAIALLALNGFFVAMILGPLCARFRDIPLIVQSIVQVAFFMTPILWSAQQIPGRAFFVALNPFHHFIEIAREPLLAGSVSVSSWLVCIAITIVMGTLATLFFARYRSRIAYWA